MQDIDDIHIFRQYLIEARDELSSALQRASATTSYCNRWVAPAGLLVLMLDELLSNVTKEQALVAVQSGFPMANPELLKVMSEIVLDQPSKIEYAQEHQRLIVERFKAGERVIDLSKEYDVSCTVIYSILHKQGVRVYSQNKLTAIQRVTRDAAIIEKSNSGLSIYQIAKELNISRSLVYQIVRRNSNSNAAHRKDNWIRKVK